MKTVNKYKNLHDNDGVVYVVPKSFSNETHEIRNKRQLEYQKNYMEICHNQFTWGFMENIKELLSETKITLNSCIC